MNAINKYKKTMTVGINIEKRSHITLVVRSAIPSTSKKSALGMWATCSIQEKKHK